MQEMKIDTEAEAAIAIIEIGTSHQGKDLDLKTISGLMEMPMISLGSYFLQYVFCKTYVLSTIFS